MSYLVKVGGSLTPAYIPAIYRVLNNIAKRNRQKIFIFPGGGRFADLIRDYRKRIALSGGIMHKMALAALDQNAYLIASLCKCKYVTSLKQAKGIKTGIAVIAPYQILTQEQPFTGRNLDIDILSSDSSAIYLAHLLKAKFIIATDVDGVYAGNPSKAGKGRPGLLRQIDTKTLSRLENGGPLDGTISALIDKYKIGTWVVNGKYPQRLYQLIKDNRVNKGTLIKPSGGRR